MDEVGQVSSARAVCWRCGRPTYDPDKRERPWARAVAAGEQVLICPACQEADPSWVERVDRCERCCGTRLTAMLGEVVCRACGHLRLASTDTQSEQAKSGA